MTREDVLQALRELEAELRARHVVHAGLFGSRARGEERADSDIDVLVQFDPDVRVGLWHVAGVKRFVSVLLRRRLKLAVDVADHGSLRPRIRPSVEADVVYAF
jgi:hypothetical protein